MSATHALLLTDVVDSTRLSETLGDAAMSELWARHDRISRDLLVVHGGREIDKTDGFLLLFDEVDAAVAYAVAYHGAIAALGLEARAGLHLGDVILRRTPEEDVARGAKPIEVDGVAKPLAARVMSVARGGQTLLTADARDALTGNALAVVSHGHWRMKGLAEPLELFEVGEDGAAFAPPADGEKVYRVVREARGWMPVREVPHHLPAERDGFVGREADLRELASTLDGSARLVSVLGPGGTGKTRLVTRYGWSWLGDWPGGVWFCDLAEARDATSVCRQAAVAFGLTMGREPVEDVARAIAERGSCVVILDNFEQVVDEAWDTLATWLDAAPQATFVVTTREVLGLPGEVVLHLSPLRQADAVALFHARASASHRGYGGGDDGQVAELVELLDRLPLAIELAAARVRMMPPAMLLARMTDRFKLLGGTGRRRGRQATLRATIDWSWDLLSADERSGLAQLSVFEGGFTLAAAEAVLELEDAWATDVVQGLVDKSLVRRVEGERLSMLVSVQEYAAERLVDPGAFPGSGAGAREAAERRHAAWFASFEPPWRAITALTERLLEAREVVAADPANIRAAARRALDHGDRPIAAGLALLAWKVATRRGPLAEGLRQVDDAIHMGGHEAEDAAWLEYARGSCLHSMGRNADAAAPLEKAVNAFRALSHPSGLAAALNDLGNARLAGGDLDGAEGNLLEAIALARQMGNRGREGGALCNIGNLRLKRGDLAGALEHYERAVEATTASGARHYTATILINIGLTRFALGDPSTAIASIDRGLELAAEIEETGVLALGRDARAQVFWAEGRLDEARRETSVGLDLARVHGSGFLVGVHLATAALVAEEEGRLDDAERLAVEACAQLEPRGASAPLAHTADVRARVLLARGEVEAAREQIEIALDAARSEVLPDARAAALCTLAWCQRLAGDQAAAGATVAEITGLTITVRSRRVVEARLAALRD